MKLRQSLPLKIEIPLILFLAGFLALTTNAARRDRLALTGEGVRRAGWIDEVALQDALAAYEGHQAVFVDARPPGPYREAHIPQAINIHPYDERVAEILSRLSTELSPQRLIIVYCEESDCDLAGELAQYLIGAGFHRVQILQGGWHSWKGAGLPVERP